MGGCFAETFAEVQSPAHAESHNLPWLEVESRLQGSLNP
jgi:hypothetical protein